jgi:hypothetical protein
MKKRYLIILLVVFSILLISSVFFGLTVKSWHYKSVAIVGEQGGFSSLALDSEGHPHIAFISHNHTIATDTDILMYATLNQSQWEINVIDSSWGIGSYFSLVLDSSGNPHVSYVDRSLDALKYASLNGSKWVIEILDLNLPVNSYPSQSLALDHSGKPHIAYIDAAEHALKYTVKTDTAWSIQTIANDSNGNPNTFNSPSIALDATDNPHISYIDDSKNNGALKYATWTDSNWNIQTVDYNESRIQTSLELDNKGNPHISYLCWNLTNYQLRYADYTKNGWNIQILDANASNPSLALDSNGNPNICYTQVTTANDFFKSENLKCAEWTGSSWSIKTIRANSWNPSLVLDSASNPHITFREDSNGGHGMVAEQLVYSFFG